MYDKLLSEAHGLLGVMLADIEDDGYAECRKPEYDTIKALVDALEEDEKQIPRWIPVDERLPDNTKDDWVLAVIQEDNGYVWIPKVVEYRESKADWFCEELGWIKDHNGFFAVTHWMPLPEAPEETK